MTLFPDVQAKAQAEIDQIVGPDRLPTFEDRERLVYCEALCREVLRWEPIAPTGVPHAMHQGRYLFYFMSVSVLRRRQMRSIRGTGFLRARWS